VLFAKVVLALMLGELAALLTRGAIPGPPEGARTR